MAYRKTYRRKLHAKEVLPIRTTAHTDTVTLAFMALLTRIGITDVPSYFRKLCIPIAISVVVCAVIGATGYGGAGFMLGCLLGLLAPAALLWLTVLLVGIAIWLGIYIAAWALIWAIFKWCLSEFFRW